jgi:hypothetical protein
VSRELRAGAILESFTSLFLIVYSLFSHCEATHSHHLNPRLLPARPFTKYLFHFPETVTEDIFELPLHYQKIRQPAGKP